METFKIDVDADGIALVTFDVPGRSMNTLTSKVMEELPQVIERIATDAAIKGAVFTSGKHLTQAGFAWQTVATEGRARG